MLAAMLQKVYIDLEWVAKEYLRRCKEKAWDVQITEDALKCFNLERILDAELIGNTAPDDLKMEDLVNEDNETE